MAERLQFLTPLRLFAGLVRAREWWDSKLPFALGVAYALAWRLRLPLHELWLPLVLLTASGITCAVYASVFNDLLDQKEDRLAGKTTGMMALSRCGKGSVLTATGAAMIAVGCLLFRFPSAFLCFLAISINYTIYSLPPVRLKARGAWGVLSIAVGEHLLAALLAAALVTSATATTPPVPWLIAVAVWSVALGLRSILWHQLCDYQNDRASHTHTLGAKYAPAFLRRLGERYVFPLEVGAFGMLLWLSEARTAWALLAFYLVLEWLRYRYMALNIIIVTPQPDFRFAMLEYYQLFFPIAFLIDLTCREPEAARLMALQLLLFPAPVWLFISHVAHLLRCRVWTFLRRQGRLRAP